MGPEPKILYLGPSEVGSTIPPYVSGMWSAAIFLPISRSSDSNKDWDIHWDVNWQRCWLLSSLKVPSLCRFRSERVLNSYPFGDEGRLSSTPHGPIFAVTRVLRADGV